jgi:hypothetical protein
VKEHTPLPWCVFDEDGYYPGIESDGGKGQSIVLYGESFEDCGVRGETHDQALVNAEFIVRACNSHYELLEALRGVVRVADRSTVEFDAARAAIAKAEGK